MIVSEEGVFKETLEESKRDIAINMFKISFIAARLGPRRRACPGLGPGGRRSEARFARLRLMTQSPRLRVSQADHDDHRRGVRVGDSDSGSESLAA
jgi:hypothetical protein